MAIAVSIFLLFAVVYFKYLPLFINAVAECFAVLVTAGLMALWSDFLKMPPALKVLAVLVALLFVWRQLQVSRHERQVSVLLWVAPWGWIVHE